ncbi:MAG: P-loop NTPase [Sandaracinaceae bacterium]
MTHERDRHQAAGLRVLEGAPSVRIAPAGAGRGPRILAVTSGKGGVGKTQVAANLAVGFALEGRRVLLLDADLGLASLDLTLGLAPEADLLSALNGERTLEQVLCEGPSGVHLIPACPGRYDMANLDAAERGRLWTLVTDVARPFDVLLIDTGAGIGSNAVGFASYAHDVLLVATPDPASLRDGYAMVKVLHRRAGHDRVLLVANQVQGDREGAAVHARMDGIVRRFLDVDLGYVGAIPRDDAVREAAASGCPFVLGAPDSRAGRAARHLARRLARGTVPEEALC